MRSYIYIWDKIIDENALFFIIGADPACLWGRGREQLEHAASLWQEKHEVLFKALGFVYTTKAVGVIEKTPGSFTAENRPE